MRLTEACAAAGQVPNSHNPLVAGSSPARPTSAPFWGHSGENRPFVLYSAVQQLGDGGVYAAGDV
jgi:hypothetical protein